MFVCLNDENRDKGSYEQERNIEINNEIKTIRIIRKTNQPTVQRTERNWTGMENELGRETSQSVSILSRSNFPIVSMAMGAVIIIIHQVDDGIVE